MPRCGEGARAIAFADAAEFGNQHPAYAADIMGESRKAIAALRSDRRHRERYATFVDAMVYGERATFDEALGTILTLAVTTWPE